jgi:hypothetical protein
MITSMSRIDLQIWVKSEYSGQKLWAFVILLALKDGASRIDFDPARGDLALTYTIQGTEYDMVPPATSLTNSIVNTLYEIIPSTSWWDRFARMILFQSVRKGRFGVRVDGMETTVDASVDRVQSSVVLRLVPETSMASVAKTALDMIRAKRGLNAPDNTAEEGMAEN